MSCGRRCLTLALGLLLLAAAACARALLGRQAWDEDRYGPLVPHTSFPADCGLCHVPERWDMVKEDFHFDHEKETGFKLVGAHRRAACLRCHNDRGPVREFLLRGCGGCHVDPHEESLGSDCAHCHDQESWAPRGIVGFHARTRFPLYGVHLGVACDRCHREARIGDFKGAPVECHLCHQGALARATSPDHRQQGWTRDCQRCHTPAGWGGGNFLHGTFPLTGAHARAACAKCHAGGRFRGTPRACIACHRDKYQNTKNPNHAQAGFSTRCELCHNTTAWKPARFDHNRFFPITSGKHKGFACRDCHPGGNARTFTCTNCHAHTKDKMDKKHRKVGGYRYESGACYRCHPRGKD